MSVENNQLKREFEWIDKWVKMTGERARIDAKVFNTYIVYEKDGELVKEYPSGEILSLDSPGNF